MSCRNFLALPATILGSPEWSGRPGYLADGPIGISEMLSSLSIQASDRGQHDLVGIGVDGDRHVGLARQEQRVVRLHRMGVDRLFGLAP